MALLGCLEVLAYWQDKDIGRRGHLKEILLLVKPNFFLFTSSPEVRNTPAILSVLGNLSTKTSPTLHTMNMDDLQIFLNLTHPPPDAPSRPTRWFPDIRDTKSAKMLHRRLHIGGWSIGE